MGSNGHRRLLQREGVAYTLAFAAPLLFITVNPADTKQPLLLVVQGGNVSIEEPLPGLREMTERLASDPAGQAFVFELVIRLFFTIVLGVRRDSIGWKRGSTDTTRQDWCTDGIAHEAMASTIFGWLRAAFGPIEAQGRGSLHPHIKAPGEECYVDPNGISYTEAEVPEVEWPCWRDGLSRGRRKPYSRCSKSS